MPELYINRKVENEKEFKCLFIDSECEVRKGVLTVCEDEIIFEESSFNKFDYIVCPSFFNAHTHLGDSIAKDPPFSGIELVVKGGYKFKMLKKYSEDCIKAMESSINLAAMSGTLKILDFRENGISGVEMLKKADKLGICKILGRPNGCDIEELIKISDGIGMSSVRDYDFEIVSELRELAKKYKKTFAIHAGEVDDKDVDLAIELKPDYIIHLNKANKEQIKRLVDYDIKLVSCFRSNAFFGVANIKNYKIFAKYDNWHIGTDNVMLASPSILEEMHFASYLLRDSNADKSIFKAAIKSNCGVVVFHNKMNLSFLRNPIFSIVRRAEVSDVECVISGKLIYK